MLMGVGGQLKGELADTVQHSLSTYSAVRPAARAQSPSNCPTLSASPTAISGSSWFVDSSSLRWYYDSSTSLPTAECRGV
jgi:hypothetical protein